MKKSLSSLEMLFVGVAMTALTACGGGGGGDGDISPGTATPAPPPAGNTPVPPSPPAQSTGLGNPSLTLSLNSNDAVLLAKKMVEAGDAGAVGTATLALGALVPGSCSGGGTITAPAAGANVQTYIYNGCNT